MDTLKDTDILHWKHSLSELIEIRLALTTSIWRMYGKRSDPRPGCFAADWLFLMVTADLPPNHNSEYLSGSLWLRDEAVRAPPGVGGGVTMDIIMTPPSPLCVCFSTMALQQSQLLLNMSSLEPVNFGVQQNNTEAFAVALCHLAELHAEQVTRVCVCLCVC